LDGVFFAKHEWHRVGEGCDAAHREIRLEGPGVSVGGKVIRRTNGQSDNKDCCDLGGKGSDRKTRAA
jgi:hypothetical protein